MLTTLIAASLAIQTKTQCPVTPDESAISKGAVEYAGAKYSFCCSGCPKEFKANPKKFAHNDKALVGIFLFDPVTGEHVDTETATLHSDYKGLRYFFNSPDDMKAFTAAPAKFTATPKKEVLQCPISGEKLDTYAQAYGYVDYSGVRYYVCCNNCFPKAKKDPAAAAKSEKGTPVAPAVVASVNAKPEIH